jgi:hypothetical protein
LRTAVGLDEAVQWHGEITINKAADQVLTLKDDIRQVADQRTAQNVLGGSLVAVGGR